MPAKGTKKKLAQKPEDLTEAQRLFYLNLTDVKSPTFGNLTETFKTTGLKHGRKPEASAMRMLANRNVLNVLCNWVNTKQQNAFLTQEINKEYVLKELRDALGDCKKAADMTNRIRVLELFGKYLDLWSNKLTVSIEQSPVLSDEDRKYLAELSRLHLARGTQQLIEACFQPNSEQIQPQAVAFDGNAKQAISDNGADIAVNADDNTSNDNDLQSNESDNPSATEHTLSDVPAAEVGLELSGDDISTETPVNPPSPGGLDSQ